MLLFICII